MQNGTDPYVTCGTAENPLRVLHASWSEEISTPFRIELDLACVSTSFDLAMLRTAPAHFGLKHSAKKEETQRRGRVALRYHGLFSSFEILDRSRDRILCHAVLEPAIYLRLSQSHGSRIYQDMTVPEIVATVLGEHGFVEEEDFRNLAAGRDYPRYEYRVQYRESAWAFLSRLMEYEGIYYHWEFAGDRTTLVYADRPEQFPPIYLDPAIPYNPMDRHRVLVATPEERDEDLWFHRQSITSLACRENTIPRWVQVRDHNWRTPNAEVAGLYPSGPARPNETFGHSGGPVEGPGVYLYGENVRTQEEAQAIARVRFEELASGERETVGQSDAPSFRAGHTFLLQDHFHSPVNRRWTIRRVAHQLTRSLEHLDTKAVAPHYQNSFSAIPDDAPFRPARTTPIPKAGPIHAVVDASSENPEHPDIDELGRYKVRLFFDPGKGTAKSSRYVRKAEVYAGDKGRGMHAPLPKGTEVILMHTNFDVDRPFLAVAIPDVGTIGPVTAKNQSFVGLRSGNGTQMLIQDDALARNLTLYCPHGETLISIGAPENV